MSYVENNYSAGYVEGDSSPSNPQAVSCDLTNVLTKIDLIDSSIDNLRNQISSIEIFLQNLATKADLQNITIQADFQDLATKADIDSKIPDVEHLTLKVIPIGTEVYVAGMGSSVCHVVGSKFVPIDEHSYNVHYTIGYEKNGKNYVSDFFSGHVVKVSDVVIEP